MEEAQTCIDSCGLFRVQTARFSRIFCSQNRVDAGGFAVTAPDAFLRE